jgi:hypothetical protein
VLQPLLFVVNDPLYLHTSDKALIIFQSVLARPGGVTLQPLLFVVNDPLYLHTSDKALMIFQSVLARPGKQTGRSSELYQRYVNTEGRSQQTRVAVA